MYIYLIFYLIWISNMSIIMGGGDKSQQQDNYVFIQKVLYMSVFIRLFWIGE